MLSKTKKILILSGMVTLLIVTGVLNVVFNNPVADTGGKEEEGTYNFFEVTRTTRINTYNQKVLFYDAIINNENYTAEQKAEAKTAKEALAAVLAQESALESMVCGLGFEDCIVTFGAETVYVYALPPNGASNFTAQEVLRIGDLIATESGRDYTEISIQPV